MKSREYSSKAVKREVIVFEEEQHGKVEDKAQGDVEPLLALVPFVAFDEQATQICDNGGKQKQQCILSVPAHVEVIAARKQDEISKTQRHDVIEEQDDWKKQQKME